WVSRPVAVPVLSGAALGEDAAAERRPVDHPDAQLHRLVEQGTRRPVHQRPAVVRDEGLKDSGTQEARHQLDRASGHAQMLGETLVADAYQLLHRSARSDRLLEADVLGIVQVQHWYAVEAEPAQAALEAAAYLGGGEVPGLEVPVHLGLQHEALG